MKVSTKKTLIYTLAVVNFAIILLQWWNHSGFLLYGKESDILIALGRLAGLLAEFFILVEIILVGRITWIEQIFGYDKMNKIHRWIGYGVLLFFVSHPLLTVIGYSQRKGVTVAEQFFNFLRIDDYFQGLVGVILFFVIILISYPIIRKKLRYETWYFVHLLMYIAISLVIGHQTFVKTGDVSSGLGLYYWSILNYGIFAVALTYRWLRPFYLFRKHRFYLAEIKKETESVYSLYIKGKNIDTYQFQAGQYANLTFLQKGMWFTHPFSFSSAPNGEYLRFSIKSLGDFTKEINALKIGTRVFIDGPMGLFVESQATTNKYLFIAGGIGITPILSLIQSLSNKNADMILMYANKTENDIPFKKELNDLNQKNNFVITNVIEDTNTSYEKGRIDKEKIQRLVSDIKERDVFICGPLPMMNSVLEILKELDVPKNQIHFEKFSY